MTRVEMIVMVTRALGIQVEPDADLTMFTDAKEIPEWAKPYVAAAYKSGIVQGKENGQFAPDAIATRAEAVTMIMRMLELMKK
ncbi:hypothetical protein CGZ75_10110 [Paenibacillus herberti]|uniref:SLH domain-containing protein n=2 Tax=Paenibacillus herberti TaxID=1619309 RepID=A0A229P5N0_9BACL|nr:hypothetical protein CGZ75_10110 [Paenibacillus herberti]